MKFTIVTPSYNQGPYIERTIQSVLDQRQAGVELEYILIDNNSIDNTPEILNRYAALYSSEEVEIIRGSDRGQFDAINQGWLKGQGDILAWLNADDIYWDKALAQVARFFQAHPEVMAAYGEAVYIDSADRVLKRVTNIRDYSRQRLLSHDFITQPATFIRRQVFEQIGLLSAQYRYVFDWEYWIRVSELFDFVRIPVVVAGYRMTGENLTVTGKGKRFREMLSLSLRAGGGLNLLRFITRLLVKYALEKPEIPLQGSSDELL